MKTPSGNSRDDIKARKIMIKDFYASWIAEHPDKKQWNKSLKAYIHVKYLSINETVGHASGTFESTEAVFHLTEILTNARLIQRKPRKQADQNQKGFSGILVMKYKNIQLIVGIQRTTREYVLYCITVPGVRKQGKK